MSESEIPQSKLEILQKEYEWCQGSAQSLESTIWQTSAVIGLGTIASFIAVVPQNSLGWKEILATGILINSAFWIWWTMARRWWSIQQAYFIRMRHIEEDLKGIYKMRYVHYLDNPSALRESQLSRVRKKELYDRAHKRVLEGTFSVHQRKGLQDFVWILPLANTLIWLLYFIWKLVTAPSK